MRKKIHTLTASEKPNASAMYKSTPMFMEPVPRRLLATCVAAKAKNRNRKVPTNSPRHEMNRWRTRLGSHPKPGKHLSPGRLGSSVNLGFMPGRTMKLCDGLWEGRVAFITAILAVFVTALCQDGVDERV
jgi:hypothetical protein